MPPPSCSIFFRILGPVRYAAQVLPRNPQEQLLTIYQLAAASMYSALGISIGFTIFTAIIFSFLRPYNQAVYAPKLKHADEKHAPPPLGKAPWSWITTVWSTKEETLMYSIGMDATVFLRFVRMCRNMFLTLCITGIGILLPVNISTFATINEDGTNWVSKITPLNVKETSIWAQVVIAWVFNCVVAGYLWWNYRKILDLRRKYFESEEYQTSLHARTLMVGQPRYRPCARAHSF